MIDDYLTAHAGTPLGHGYPSGSPLRADGESHRQAWMRIVRADPCAYCGGAAGTIDHIEPKTLPIRGVGGAHTWLNYAAACGRCNGNKGRRSLLAYLFQTRHGTGLASMRAPPRPSRDGATRPTVAREAA